MKRNDNLKTLSWEHHDGLVVAFRLQQGLKNEIPGKILRDYILHVWDNALEHHFWQEEQSITRILHRTAEGKKLEKRMMNEHEEFRIIISQLRNSLGSESDIEQFAANLNLHIRFEERELFPFIETHSSTEELVRIGNFLQNEHTTACSDWEPRFWKKTSDSGQRPALSN
jgi:hemerythrin-like domain-containing protein